MNRFDDKVIEWSEHEFKVKLNSKENLNLFRGKNGNNFKKFFNFMTERIKSKENGEKIKRFCDSIKYKNELKTIGNEVKELESKVSSSGDQLIEEEFNRRTIEIGINLNQNKIFVSNLVLNAIEKISAKNKLCLQLNPNLMAINETIGSFEQLFTTFYVFDPQISDSMEQTISSTEDLNCGQLLDQITQLIDDINHILFDLNQLQLIQPIPMKFDLQLLFRALSPLEPLLESEQLNENEKYPKNIGIDSKLISIQDLMEKYKTIRSEKLEKMRNKLEKVINNCDVFIQQNV